ncbi:3-isopropylmalate dehydrogenase [Alicyclobacillaceae bacterium I2511]|nr:3-isopropylmalate dehydrogenase [Alicyclobacillaceae bacterium I2511]
MQATLTILSGDGVGPEVTAQAEKLLTTVATVFHHDFYLPTGLIGGAALEATGEPLPDATLSLCRQSEAVLLGAVGGPKWDTLPGNKRPETGLLGLRKALQVFANLRPILVWPELSGASPLKPEVLSGTDMVLVRELTGGLYFGVPRERRFEDSGLAVVDTLHYTEREMERLIRLGFTMAQGRRGQLISVDKANVLESSRLWREVVERVSIEFPGVQVQHMLVDSAAMQLVKNPRQFDVLVTENLFGDILSDEAATLTGSIGMLPSASLSENGPGLYEPIHGSAPDIAGQNLANPLGTLLSVAMLLRFSLKLMREAEAVERAVRSVVSAGYRTRDLVQPGENWIGTDKMGDKVCQYLREEEQNGEHTI